MQRYPTRIIVAAAVTAILIAGAGRARACPFCNAAMQTLSQEIEAADVAVIAELAQAMPSTPLDATSGAVSPDGAAAKFRVVQVLRGEDKLAGTKELEVVYFGQDSPGKKFLISGLAGVTGPGLDWTTPVPLSERAVLYVRNLPLVGPQGLDRLTYFQDYLEDDDPLLAQDAYDEFARAPYADIVALGPYMKHDKLLGWIRDASVGPSSRRLFLTMLGVCGQPDDIPMLEEFINYDYQLMKPGVAAMISTSGLTSFSVGVGLVDEVLHAAERRKRESLDALIACYIKLKGPDALPLINERFLGNPKTEYKHLHSAIMALRFHGEETDIIPREKLLESIRLALEHKEFADQVIPDLARWEDWEVMPRLVKMFKDSPADDWIRQPVVSYLLVAEEQPGDVGAQAQAAIKELEALDADTVERARTLQAFAIMPRAGAPVPAATDPATQAAGGGNGTATPAPTAAATPSAAPTSDAAQAAAPASSGATEQGAESETAVAPNDQAADAAAAHPPAPSNIKIIGVPLLSAAVLLAIFAVLLRGADPRSSDENA
jgi:hypothetical protein